MKNPRLFFLGAGAGSPLPLFSLENELVIRIVFLVPQMLQSSASPLVPIDHSSKVRTGHTDQEPGGKRMIDGETLLYTSMAYPNRGSKSPVIWNAAFRSAGLNCAFLAFEPKDIEAAMSSLRTLNIQGSSISNPYKETVMRYLDEIDPTAREIGAVNTVRNREGRLIGYNYDWVGAVRALEDVVRLGKKHVVVVGAGGAGRAIVFGLRKRGATVILFDADREKARRLSEEFGVELGGGPEALNRLADYDILINATPVGSYSDPDHSAVPEDILQKGKTVFDIVFNPLETRLMKESKRAGCEVIPGYKMLLYQAASQFSLFTGLDAPLEIMERSLLGSDSL